MDKLRWLPVLIWLIVICYLSFSSLEHLQVPQFFSVDKIGHFGMYSILGALLYFAVKKKHKAFLYSISLAAIFSGLTELIQHFFVLNRVGDWFDFMANLSGLIFVIIIYQYKLKHNN